MRTLLPSLKSGKTPTKYRLLLILLLSLLGALPVYAQTSGAVPTVTSDKDDYSPGEVATITGTGWTQDQQVHVEFKEEPDYPDYHVYDVAVDASGTWVIKYSIEQRHLGVKFTVNAVGQQSGAVALTSFTDGNVRFKTSSNYGDISITLAYRDKSNCSGSLISTATGTVTNNYNNSTNKLVDIGKSLSVEAPATTSNGLVFSSWSGGTAVTVDPANPRIICINGTADVQDIQLTYVNCTAPSVTTQPASQSATYGSNASFTVTASGTALLSYQWQALSTATGAAWTSLPTTTATLTLVKPTVAMNGYQYRCVISNSCGTATSNAVVLLVSAKTVTVTGITANTKEYDGTTTAILTTSNALLTGVVSGETLTLTTTGATATFADRNIGNKAVTVSGLGLSGATASNYTLTQPTGLTAAITVKNLTVSGVTARNKVYDGTTAASLLTTGATLTGVIGGETVTLTSTNAIGTFASANTGTIKPVIASGFALGGAAASNYTLSQPVGLTAAITPASLTYTATTASRPYGTSNGSITGTVTGFVSSETLATATTGTAAFTSAADATSPVGTYAITGAGLTALNGNYTFEQALGNATALTVAPASNSIAFAPVSAQTYAPGATVALVASASSGPVGFDVTAGPATVSGNILTLTGAGSVTVMASQQGSNANYALAAPVSQTFTVAQASNSITFNALANKVYGDAPFDLNATATAGLPVSFAVTSGPASYSASTGKLTITGAGTVTITASQAGNANYAAATAIAQSFLVDKAATTATVVGGSFGYDALAHPATGVSVGGGVNGDALTAALTYEGALGTTYASTTIPPTNAGSYLATAAYAGSDNYKPSSATTTITIGQKELTVTADNKQKDYGDANPALTVSYSGFAGTDDASVLTTAPTIATTATRSSSIGSYAISASGGVASNYSFRYVAGVLTVGKVTLTVAAAAASREYGDANPTFEATITGQKNGDTFTTGGSTTATTTSPVGSAYVITPTVSGANLANYTVVPVASTLTITKATLTVVADNKTKAYGDDNPTFTGTITGQKNNESFGFQASTTATSTSPVSAAGVSYAIVPAATGSTLGNYSVAPVNGVLTIAARPITVAADAKSKTYGDADPALTYQLTSGNLIGTDGITGSLSRSAGSDVGTYAINQSTLSAGANYNLTYQPATLTITARVIAVTPRASQNKIYGSADPILTYNADALVGSDAFAGSLARVAGNNVGSYTITQGTLALSSNYELTFTPNVQFVITAKQLTATIAASNKVYDGTTAAVATGSVPMAAVLSGDDVQVVVTGAAFDSKNAGTAKPVTATVALGGAAAPNYSLAAATAATTATITEAGLTPSFTAADKVYDGTTAATITGHTLAGVIGMDKVSLTGGNAVFADKKVGVGKTVTGAGFGLTGDDAGNYSLLVANPTATASITAKELTIAITATSKVYDGNRDAAVVAAIANGLVSGDNVNVAASNGLFDNKNVGTSKSVTATVAASGTDAANYSANTTATTTASITTKAIVAAVTVANKVYDGTTAATLLTRTLSGQVAGDDVSLTGGAATFANKNTGVGKTVTAVDLTLEGADKQNYTFNATATTTADITAKQLTAAIMASDKGYDGTDNAVATGSVPTAQLISGETVTVAVTNAKFNNKNVGTGKPVTATVSLGGPAASNYGLTAPTAATTAAITAKALAIGVAATDKVYDGNTTATVSASISSGLVAGDVVTVAASNGVFSDKNVGTGKTVTADVSIAGGADGGNYVAAATATTTASIRPKALVASATASNKVYDALPSATITSRAISGQVPTDVVSLTGGTATFADKQVGVGKTVTIVGLGLTGTDAGNYSFNASATTTADITKLCTTASFTSKDKVYDGTTAADVVKTSVAAAISGDNVVLTGGNATFNSKNVGAGKTVTLAGAALTGADAGNYTLTSVATTTAAISPRDLLVTATGTNKVFDGSATATVTLADNRVTGDGLTTAYTSAAFADANIGTGKTVTVSGISISGTDAGNYTANTTTTTTATITAAATSIAVANSGPMQYSDKVTFTATLTSATAQAVLNSTGGTVEFKLTSNNATVSLGSSAYPGNWSVANGVATVMKDFVLSQKAGTYTVTAIFTPASGNITSVTNTAGSVVVGVEDATLVYAGLEYFGTANSTSSTANVEYITTVTDAADSFRGDITKAKAVFLDASTNTPQFDPTYAVLANSPTDATVGTARTGVKTVTLTTGEFNNGGKTIDLVTAAQGEYYTGRTIEHTLITIAVPGQDYVNGGGNVVATQSSGTYAATAGSKMNFGFTMKWNKSGKNIQGQANIIFRRLVAGVWRTYQIKSNAINTLGTASTSAGNQGDFNTKANLTDITDPLASFNITGNLDLSVQAFESTVTGSAHKIGVTLRDASGVLLFSNNWTGTKTDMQPLGGGKISVRSTATVSTATSTAKEAAPVAAVTAAATADPVNAPTSNLLEVFPNPLRATGTVHFHATAGGKAQVYVYNAVGALVATLYNAEIAGGQEYSLSLSADNLADGMYSCRLIVNGKVENKRFTIQH